MNDSNVDDWACVSWSLFVLFVPAFLGNRQDISDDIYRVATHPIPFWLIIWGIRGIVARGSPQISGSVIMTGLGSAVLVAIWSEWMWLSDAAYSILIMLVVLTWVHARAQLLSEASGYEPISLWGFSFPLWLSTYLRLLHPDTWKGRYRGVQFTSSLLEGKEGRVALGDNLIGGQAFACMARGKLDLTEAAFHTATVNVQVFLAGMEIKVPWDCEIKINVTRFLGIITILQDKSEPATDVTCQRVLNLTGLVLFSRLRVVKLLKSDVTALAVTPDNVLNEQVTDSVEATRLTYSAITKRITDTIEEMSYGMDTQENSIAETPLYKQGILGYLPRRFIIFLDRFNDSGWLSRNTTRMLHSFNSFAHITGLIMAVYFIEKEKPQLAGLSLGVIFLLLFITLMYYDEEIKEIDDMTTSYSAFSLIFIGGLIASGYLISQNQPGWAGAILFLSFLRGSLGLITVSERSVNPSFYLFGVLILICGIITSIYLFFLGRLYWAVGILIVTLLCFIGGKPARTQKSNKYSVRKTITKIPNRLSPWKLLDYLRLLWWIWVTPQRLRVYRKTFGKEDEKRMSRWLVSTLLWLPPLIPTLALAIGTLPSQETGIGLDILHVFYPVWSACLILGWTLTGWLSNKGGGRVTRVILWVVYGVVFSGEITIAFSAGGAFGGIVILIALSIAYADALGVASDVGGSLTRTWAKKQLVSEEDTVVDEHEGLEIDQFNWRGVRFLGLLLLIYAFLIWFSFL